MNKLIMALTFAAFSSSSFAGYKCDFTLSQNGKEISKKSEYMGGAISGSLAIVLNVEVQKGSLEKSSGYESKELILYGLMSGYPADHYGQQIEFSVGRSHIGTKRDKFFEYKDHGSVLTEEVELNGKATKTIEFESYKLLTSCDFAEDKIYSVNNSVQGL